MAYEETFVPKIGAAERLTLSEHIGIGNCDHQALAPQHRGRASRARLIMRNHDVDRSGLNARGELLGHVFDEAQGNIGREGTHIGQNMMKISCTGRRVMVADCDPARLSARDVACDGKQQVGVVDEMARFAEKVRAGECGLDAAARTVENAKSGLILELANSSTQHRWLDAQYLSGPAETLVFGSGDGKFDML